jgi:putative ABC transport system substrate-binding protein
MDRRWFIACLGGAVLVIPAYATAQTRVAHIAVLLSRLPAQLPIPVWPAFVERLRERGWEEGRNLDFQLRAGEGITERYQHLAAELVALKPDLIIATGSQATRSMRELTDTIPIVMIGSSDPIGAGFIASLARPGGNITGVTNQLGDLGEKVFQIFKEFRPGTSRLALFWNPDDPGSKSGAETQLASGARHGFAIQSIPIKSREDLGAALAALAENLPEALDVHPTPILAASVDAITNFALHHRLPSVTASAAMARAGLLASYAPDPVSMWRRAADYVDRILKGAKPAELPVEQPTKFEFVINLKTARAIGLDVSQSLLLRADEIIE